MSGTTQTEGASGSASGGKLEERLDLSAETDAKLAQAQQLVQAGQLEEALALYMAWEKKCRVGNDNKSLVKVCQAALTACHEAHHHALLLQTLNTLATRRSQKTTAITALVHTAMPWCMIEPYTPLPLSSEESSLMMMTDVSTAIQARNQLVAALRDLTHGKIFLERERAQLTRVMATIKEQEGDVAAAADELQQVHVETYGSLSKREKVEFILEQMRLTLAKRDFVRSAIVAGKVSRKHLQEENMETYKIRFYQLMTILHRQEQEALELAKDYFAMYSTPTTADEAKAEAPWKMALQSTVLFLVLSPYSNEQQDLMHRLVTDPQLEQVPACQTTLKLFLKKEIINYPLPHQAELESLPAFLEGDAGLVQHWRETFHRRIIQHNIRVVSGYYQRIHGARLAQLLQLEPARLEAELSAMVSEGAVYAKIDRPKDIVRFAAPQNPEAVLSDWAADIDKLLHLVETTTHLIHKEHMTTQ